MRMIANKPCSFGGERFYIGDEIPENLVADARTQEKYGVITIVNDDTRVPDGRSGTPFAREYDSVVPITVKSTADGQYAAIPVRPEEIQQVFSILQMGAEDGARAVADVESENVLILLHAADSRKTIKNAAKEQADKLFSVGEDSKESTGGNATTGTNTEGADT